MLKNKKILLIITGSIAAYKSLFLIRLLKENNASVNVVMTKSAKKFITPLSISSLSENKVYENIFDLTDESKMGHIKLAKIHDLIIVVPASANFISKVACGLADDLASTILLASKSKVIFVPAMNVVMQENKIIKDNIKTLQNNGYKFLFGESGDLACGDYGIGRMSEPVNILNYILHESSNALLFKGIETLITAGPTLEPIDPVRFISNKSSGIQGYLLAQELANNGAKVTLISGPTNLKKPDSLDSFIEVETAEQMHKACLKKIPKDLFLSVAAVSDWKVQYNKNKIKKNKKPPNIKFFNNPDILQAISTHKKRPKLVVGFAAETENLIDNAMKKIKKKKCDIIIANNVSSNRNVFGGNMNAVNIINKKGSLLELPKMTKSKIAKKILHEVILPLLN
jgi:phosphopantothenoylcysteine decarboxylase / phosphopantothenate---cysteine ligase